jgi:DNA replication and repair protein RecF
LAAWRSYNRALKQRNAALRSQEANDRITAWDENLIEHGEAVHLARTEYLADILPLFESICSETLQLDVKCCYVQGWKEPQTLAESLKLSTNNDRSKGFTQVGPHRADLRLEVQDRRARHWVSRGQQKMVAAALVIAQTSFLADDMSGDLVLLVDDPAAELDRVNRERLFELLQNVDAQLFITALETDNLGSFSSGSNYRITHGELASLL